MGKRDNAVMVRLDDPQLADLEKMAGALEIPASTLAHNAVTALLRAYRRDGFITAPMEFTSRERTYLQATDVVDPALNEAAPIPGAAPQAAAAAATRRSRRRVQEATAGNKPPAHK